MLRLRTPCNFLCANHRVSFPLRQLPISAIHKRAARTPRELFLQFKLTPHSDVIFRLREQLLMASCV